MSRVAVCHSCLATFQDCICGGMKPTPEPSKWVSVEDRLPEKEGLYLAASNKPERENPLMGDYSDYLYAFDPSEKVWQHMSGLYDHGITHWLPYESLPPIETP